MSEDKQAASTGIITKSSPRTVAETAALFAEILNDKGLRLFATIDQKAEAERVGLEMRETTLVLFGSPRAGTPVMVSVPLAAIDLPLKILIWDDAGQTKVSYLSPDALAARYSLSPELAANLAGIDPLTDALVAG
jgi:uncharacterized protein (DUF302 family)